MNALCPFERLVALGGAAGFDLTFDQIAQIQTYLGLLAKWNATVNLTALPLAGFPEASLDRLVGESLKCASLLSEKRPLPSQWFDLGSGGGSPAIPLKIVHPTVPLTMVEARSRKAAFLREAIRTLNLEHAAVLNTRVQDLERKVDSRGVDFISFRALRLDLDLAKCLRRLAITGGRIALFGSVSWEFLRSDFELDQVQGPVTLLRRRECST